MLETKRNNPKSQLPDNQCFFFRYTKKRNKKKCYISKMKHIVTILSIAVLFTACKSGTETQNTEAEAIAARVKPIIQGTWVMTDYITSLQQTKSPLASSKVLKDIVMLDILADSINDKGDSMGVSGSLNNHEGLAFNIYFRKGHTETAIPMEYTDNDGSFYELDYTIANNDTTLVVNHYGKDNKVIAKRDFTKWKQPVADYDEPSPLQRTVNKVLFAGKYRATDDAGKTYDWELTNGGILLGVEGHKTYYVFTDFIAEEEGYLVDEMCFDEHEKTQKPFIFSIKGDTTYLYQAKENNERTKIEKGDLKYTLLKQ
jgi:hypothetical protein